MRDERRVLAYTTKSGSRIRCRALPEGLLISFPRRNTFEAIRDAMNALRGEGLILLAIVPMLLAYSLHSVWRSGWSAAVLTMFTISVMGVAFAVGGVFWLRRGTRLLLRRDELVIRTPGMGARIFATIERRCRATDVASVRAERGMLYIRMKDGTHLWDGAQDADLSWDDGYDAEDMEWVAVRVREALRLTN